MTRFALSSIAALSLALVSCNDGTAPLESAVGCYEVAMTGGPSEFSGKVIRLDQAPDSLSYRPVRPVSEANEYEAFFLTGTWGFASDNSLHLATGGGYVGMTWKFNRVVPAPPSFRILAPTWSGTVHMWSDTPPLGEGDWPAFLYRVDCVD